MIDLNSELFNALGVQDAVEVSEELYCNFFEILPPIEISHNGFVFREGAGEEVKFWKQGDKYFARTVSDLLMDAEFNHWVHWRFKEGVYVVVGVSSDDLRDLVGKPFACLADLRTEVSVCFDEIGSHEVA